MKVVSAPNNASAVWRFKVESLEGATAVEVDLATGGQVPVVGQWQTFNFPLKTLAAAGLDVSSIDVLMVFPAWGAGEGAVYQMTNVKIAQANISYPELVLFKDGKNPDWPMWDCCAGSTPIETTDDAEHGAVAEFSIGATPTVMGFITRTANSGGNKPFDATALLDGGLVQFDMKVVNAPSSADASWKLKIESNAGATAVEIDLTKSVEGKAPVTGQWQTYSFKLADLAAAGLDVTTIDVVMIFPAWGTGNGAVYRVDNAKIYKPGTEQPDPTITMFADAPATDWSIWDCCGGSTPTIEEDDDTHGKTAQFIIGGAPTVMGLSAGKDVFQDVSALMPDGVLRFEMKVVTPPSDSSAVWKFKIESNNAAEAVELDLAASSEGKAPVPGQWQTYTFPLKTLADKGLDMTAIDVIMIFPAWGTGNGAVYRIDNVKFSAN